MSDKPIINAVIESTSTVQRADNTDTNIDVIVVTQLDRGGDTQKYIDVFFVGDNASQHITLYFHDAIKLGRALNMLREDQS